MSIITNQGIPSFASQHTVNLDKEGDFILNNKQGQAQYRIERDTIGNKKYLHNVITHEWQLLTNTQYLNLLNELADSIETAS